MPLELIPSLVNACRLALAISVTVFSYRVTMAIFGKPAVFLTGEVLTDVAVFGYTAFLALWLAIEAVGELHRVGKKLAASVPPTEPVPNHRG